MFSSISDFSSSFDLDFSDPCQNPSVFSPYNCFGNDNQAPFTSDSGSDFTTPATSLFDDFSGFDVSHNLYSQRIGEEYPLFWNQTHLKHNLDCYNIDDDPYLPASHDTPRISEHSDTLYLEGIPPNVLYNAVPRGDVAFPQVFSQPPSHVPVPVYQDGLVEESESHSEGDGSDDEYIPSPLPRPRKQLPAHRRPIKRTRDASVAAASTMPSRAAVRLNKANPWACPHPGCSWVQTNRRTPDLKRHIKKHDPPEWQCCGCQKNFSRRDALRRHTRNKNNTCVNLF